MSGEIGYINITNAEAYFATRLSATAWTSIVDDSGKTRKTAALTTAYDRLYYSGLLELPGQGEGVENVHVAIVVEVAASEG